MLNKIKEESRKGLVLCFAGTGSMFGKRVGQSSLIIAKNGVTILVDVGNTIPTELYKQGIKITDFDYYHLTHSHDDHIGGVGELLLLSRYVTKTLPKIIITEHYQDILWEKSLKGGQEYNEEGLLRFSDLMKPLRPKWMSVQPREMYRINVEGIDLVIFRTKHIPGGVAEWEQAFWSTGLIIDGRVLYSGDTRFDTSMFVDVDTTNVQTIFHDCQLFNPGAVHASYDELKNLPELIKNKMYLYHYGDNWDEVDDKGVRKWIPEKDGFKGFAKQWEIYQFPADMNKISLCQEEAKKPTGITKIKL
jgi:ribonuclease BN (tRNA processing enzyme)